MKLGYKQVSNLTEDCALHYFMLFLKFSDVEPQYSYKLRSYKKDCSCLEANSLYPYSKSEYLKSSVEMSLKGNAWTTTYVEIGMSISCSLPYFEKGILSCG